MMMLLGRRQLVDEYGNHIAVWALGATRSLITPFEQPRERICLSLVLPGHFRTEPSRREELGMRGATRERARRPVTEESTKQTEPAAATATGESDQVVLGLRLSAW